MKSLTEWLNSEEIRKLRKTNIRRMLEQVFLRDPMRTIYYDPEIMYSPVDGVVLYVHEKINPNDEIVDIKGKVYNLKKVLENDNYNSPSIVIGIFLTFFSVHMSRIPTNGFIKVRSIDPIITNNLSMRDMENDILKQIVHPRRFRRSLEFLYYNQRDVVEVVHPLGFKYYVVLIADQEVNANVFLIDEDGEFVNQGDRICIIRWGSLGELVIPLNNQIEFECLLKSPKKTEDFVYVEAGIDPLIRIKSKRKIFFKEVG